MLLAAARPRFLRAARAPLAAVALAGVAACSSESTAPDASVVGAYTLRSYNGSELPYTQTLNGFRTELLAGAITLRGDRSFDLALEARDTDLASGAVDSYTVAYTGRYAVSGRVVTFSNTNDADGDGITGDLDGGTGTVTGTTVVIGTYVFGQ